MDGLAASIGTDRGATTALARTVQRLAPRWFVIRDVHVNNGIALAAMFDTGCPPR